MKVLPLLLLAAAAPAGAETIFVSDEGSSCVWAVDRGTKQAPQCITVGERPRGLGLSRDGKRLYVAVSNRDAIVVVDTASRKVVRTFKSGSDPETFALSPDESRIYIANEDANLLTVISTASGKVEREVEVGGEPEGTAVSPDGETIVQTSETSSMAHVINAATGKLRANLMVDSRPRFVTFTPDGKRFWVSSEVRGTVEVFDAATFARLGKIDFEAAKLTDGVIQPVGIRFTRDGKKAFVALGRAKLVAEVDPQTLRIRRTWPVGFRAWNLALSPDETRIYTADGLDGTMSIIDLKANKALPPTKLGGKPWGIEVVR